MRFSEQDQVSKESEKKAKKRKQPRDGGSSPRGLTIKREKAASEQEA